jgi:hypothetical protein
MARYALVNEEGETETIILWDGVSDYAPPAGLSLLPEAEAPPRRTQPAPVPEVVTNFQARAALRRIGLLEQVQAAVQAAGGEALDAWEYANHVHRNGALVISLSEALGLTADEVDALFRMAESIEA